MNRSLRLKEAKKEWRTDRVREVGNNDHMAAWIRGTERFKVEAKGIRVAKVKARRACRARRKVFHEGGVNFKRQNMSGHGGEAEGENPTPGADFDRQIAGTEGCSLDDRLGHSLVAEEVLAQGLAARCARGRSRPTPPGL